MYSQLQNLYPILLSDTIVYDRPMMLYIGTGGSLRVLTSGGDDVTLRNVPDGSTLPILVSKVFATGSTVGNVLATQFDGDVLNYFSTFPSWVLREFSLAFDAEGAEELGDYEAGTLYFRDSNFNRVPATFSRTTTATRVNEQGLIETVAVNVPRIDYTDGSAKLLMEPSRTNTFANSLLQNGDLNLVKLSATDNDGISPDGTQNATLYESTIAGAPAASAFTGSITTGTYSYSWFFKPVNIDFVGFVIGDSSNRVRTTYDIANDTFLSFNNQGVASGVSAEAKFYANGWYRFEIVVTFSGDIATGYSAQVVGTDVYNYPYFTVVTKDDFAFYLWGLQIEVGSYPTSYIPTAGSAVTRNEDSFQNNSLGSYFNTNEGSIYWKYTDNPLLLSTVNINSFGVNEVFGSKYIRYRGRDDASLIQSTGVANNISFAGTDIHLLSYSVRWDGTNVSVFGDSSLIDSEPQSDDFNPVSFGYSSGGIDASVTTKYEKIIFFPTALTDDQCKDLTLDGYDSYEAMAAALGYTTY